MLFMPIGFVSLQGHPFLCPVNVVPILKNEDKGEYLKLESPTKKDFRRTFETSQSNTRISNFHSNFGHLFILHLFLEITFPSFKKKLESV